MKTAISTAGLLFLNLFVESTTASCGHGTSLLKRKVTISKRQEGGAPQKTVEVGKFAYLGVQGPTGWAGLAAENAACAISTQQSPIDITNTSTTVVPAGTLQLNFPNTATAEFENIGTTIEVVMEGKGATTTVNGKEFALKQFHFHSPSEHTVDGEFFPLEMHMVHEAADKSIAVIAAQFQLSENGETTALLTSVTENIGRITTPGTVTETGALDFGGLVTALNAQNLNTYSGSLTTPPCAEGLSFFVTSQQLPLDVATFNKIKAVVGFNARFAQNTAGQENLLSLASKQVALAGGANGGAGNATAPGRVAPPARVETPLVIAPPPAASLAPAPARGNQGNGRNNGNNRNNGNAGNNAGNVQIIRPGQGQQGANGGNAALTPETAALIESLTGIKVTK